MELNENKQKLREYRERAKELVAQMTLEEKVEQTLHRSPAVERLGIKKYNWCGKGRDCDSVSAGSRDGCNV